MFMVLFGTVAIAGIVGYVFERTEFTNNGILQSIIICLADAFPRYFVRIMLGICYNSPGVNAILPSLGALTMVPIHWRRAARDRRWR